jgi:hypothetical protein
LNPRFTSVGKLAAALLLAGIVASACGRPGIAPGTQSGGSPAATAADTAGAPDVTAAPSQPGDASATPSPAPSDGAADASPAGSNGPDPVAGDLQSIDQLLKNLDGSLSGTDSGE